MTEKMSKTKYVLFFIAIQMTNFAIMANTMIFVILNDMYASYAQQVALISTAISLPLLIKAFSAVAVPPLLKNVNKKILLVVGEILFGISGLLTVAVDNA